MPILNLILFAIGASQDLCLKLCSWLIFTLLPRLDRYFPACLDVIPRGLIRLALLTVWVSTLSLSRFLLAVLHFGILLRFVFVLLLLEIAGLCQDLIEESCFAFPILES